MFSEFYSHEIREKLVNCLRVFPHDQDTSGFFITIISKVAPLPEELEANSQEKRDTYLENLNKNLDKDYKNNARLIQKKSNQKSFEFLHCNPDDPDTQYIKAYYGLDVGFRTERLIT